MDYVIFHEIILNWIEFNLIDSVQVKQAFYLNWISRSRPDASVLDFEEVFAV